MEPKAEAEADDDERYSTPVPEKNKRTQIVLVTVLKFAMPTLLRLTSRVLVRSGRERRNRRDAPRREGEKGGKKDNG